MTTLTPAPDPGPGPVDWDALNSEVFGDEDPEQAANEEADRQFHRWTAASSLASKMRLEGADRASITRAVSQAYPDITLPDYEAYNAIAAPAEPVAAKPAVQDEPAAVASDVEDDQAVQPLSLAMKWVIGYVAAAVAALAVLGFVVSFDTQVKAVEPFFGKYAPLVPLAIDLGIVVFAALNLVLARLNLSILWLRAVPWVLTAMSLYINLSAHHELVARVAHVALPGMWIVASEVGTHILRIRAGLEAGTRTESLGIVRWFLAPVSTFRLWRHMRLWGVRTAAGAREVESTRLEAKAALRFRYGLAWRFAAPVQLRTAYGLRRLTDTEVYTFIPPQVADDQAPKATEPATPAAPVPAAAAPRPTRKAPAKQATAKGAEKAAAPRVDDAEAMTRLRALAPDESGHVSIKRARAELHCGSDRAKRLLAEAGLLTPEPATD